MAAMHTHTAMLRAINLGSRNRISLPDLRALFEAIGAEAVETYVQSGNVVFKSPQRSPTMLVRTIEDCIATDLGLDIRVLLRTAKEIEAVVRDSPFDGEGHDPAALHVTFCADTPSTDRVRELNAMDFAPDEVSVAGRDVYLSCPGGYGRSKLSNAFLEKRLGVVATTRNWKTVRALADLAGAANR